VNPEIELEELQDLIDQLLRGVQETLLSGERLTDEFQGLLAQELTIATQRIDQLNIQIQQQREQARTPEALALLGRPPSADAQLLWQLSGQQEQAFISYLRDFPSDATNELLRNPAELSRTIEYLNRISPEGTAPVVDGIPHADLNSSNVWGSKYDRRTGVLTVRFQGGSEYEYDGVPANIYRAFANGNAAAKTKGKNQYGEWWPNKNPSLGAALNQYIKASGFNYRKIK
jgi:hypothetical protein